LQFLDSTLSAVLFVPNHREKEFPHLTKGLIRQLDTDQPFIGDVWGAADCAIQANLTYLPLLFPHIDLAPYPSIQATIEHIQRRPAHRKAIGARVSCLLNETEFKNLSTHIGDLR